MRDGTPCAGAQMGRERHRADGLVGYPVGDVERLVAGRAGQECLVPGGRRAVGIERRAHPRGQRRPVGALRKLFLAVEDQLYRTRRGSPRQRDDVFNSPPNPPCAARTIRPAARPCTATVLPCDAGELYDPCLGAQRVLLAGP